jgi:2-oxoglutarate ferredoxin oxidoreductase subunit gamma
MAEPFKIIICGEGGQGALSIAEILAFAAYLQGKHAVATPHFSTEKRGGVSMAYVQISDEPIPFFKFDRADLWVVLSQRSIDRIAGFLQEGTRVIVNSFLVKDISAIAKWQPHQIDATELAKVKLKKPRTFNMIILGAMAALVPGLDRKVFAQALDKHFGSKYAKDPGLKALNEQAFDLGYDLMK